MCPTGNGRLIATVEETACLAKGKPYQRNTLKLRDRRQFLASLAVIPLSRHDPQAMGSATAYGRRNFHIAMLGIATEDNNDGYMETHTFKTVNYRQRTVQANPILHK